MEPDWEAESPPRDCVRLVADGQAIQLLGKGLNLPGSRDPADMGSDRRPVPVKGGTVMARRALPSLVNLGLVVGLAVPAQAATESKVTG
jgi:hypothetical protein